MVTAVTCGYCEPRPCVGANRTLSHVPYVAYRTNTYVTFNYDLFERERKIIEGGERGGGLFESDLLRGQPLYGRTNRALVNMAFPTADLGCRLYGKVVSKLWERDGDTKEMIGNE